MSYFGQFRDHTINALLPLANGDSSPRLLQDPTVATLENAHSGRILSFASDDGVTLAQGDLHDQFLLFQLSPDEQGPAVLDMSMAQPTQDGSDERPDMLAQLQLASFHIGAGEGIAPDTKATLRIDFGKDESSESNLDTLFWSVAAGLSLYDDAKKQRTEPKSMKANFSEAFSRRPVEIPGGLGRLSFEVVKHKEPPWWRRVFTFLQSGTGQSLTSAIGFPAITSQAIGLVDELVNRLEKSKPEILFKSRPMTLALTKRAYDYYRAGVPSVTVGTLNPGFCLLARGRDYQTLIDNEPTFMGAFGVLKPKALPVADFLRAPSENPFEELTYAVLRVGTAETKLSPSVSFGGTR